MSFPLGSLLGDGAASATGPNAAAASQPPHAPWRRKALLFAAALAWLLLLLALLTYSRADAAFTTSGTGEPVHNKAGVLGARVVDALYFVFGFSAWWILPVTLRAWLSALAASLRHAPDAPVTATPAAAAKLAKRAAAQSLAGGRTLAASAAAAPWMVWLGLALLLAASSALEWTRLYRFEGLLPGGHSGGVLGLLLGQSSSRWLGFAGSGVLWISVLVAAVALAMRFSWLRLAERIGERLDGLREQREDRRAAVEDRRLGELAAREREVKPVVVREQEAAPIVPLLIEQAVVEVPISQRVAKERQAPLFSELADTKLPQVDLLDAAQHREASVNAESLEMTSRLIEKKLSDFGVEVHVVAASPGPVITRYEIEPATGVKGSQIVGLAKDLARSLSLISIRVVEVIPGKTTMALELPNARRQTIKLSEILGSEVYNQSASMLTIGMGKDIVGNPIVADLAKMPHCLVAGTTGSGKSVGINAMILSLLYKAEARDVRLILIDPKMLEMSVYEGIPHLLCPVVIDMKQAANALNWCVGEMERRYKIMSKLGVRNLAGYNKKIADAEAKGEKLGNPFSLTPEAPEPLERLPQIVVVIDELADLMMVIGKKIEELIARLAQKARAAGVHLVLATQRPSVDVITGLIKANIPTRLSFQVSSKIDSRTILDQMGAEALLGQGDMLYLASGSGVPVRVHGAFVSDDEVHRVVEYLKAQGEPNYIEGILEGGVLEGGGSGGEGGGDLAPGEGSEADPMYDQAVGIVLQHRRASISLVQRHLRIGYNHAARLLEQMEKSGVVTAMSSNGNRDILVPAREGRAE